MTNVMSLPSVGPYVGVSRDKIVEPEGADRKIRVLVYGAYNAMGLIGSEHNGIAILDETNKTVLVDGIEKAASGYCGPTLCQRLGFDAVCAMGWAEIVELIRGHPRTRGAL